MYTLAADLLLLLHIGVVVFVVFGLVLVGVGAWRNWRWVRNPWFRWIHLLFVAVIVYQSWAGKLCPLTVWETSLREKGGGEGYSGSFLSHWMEELLYVEAPVWAFAVAYSLFGLLVIASWIWVRPTRP